MADAGHIFSTIDTLTGGYFATQIGFVGNVEAIETTHSGGARFVRQDGATLLLDIDRDDDGSGYLITIQDPDEQILEQDGAPLWSPEDVQALIDRIAGWASS